MEKVVTHAGSLLKNNIQDKTVRAALRFMGWNPAANNAHAQFADWFGSDFESSFTPEENSAVFSSVADNATFKHFSDDNLFVYDQRGYSKLSLLFFRVSLLTSWLFETTRHLY